MHFFVFTIISSFLAVVPPAEALIEQRQEKSDWKPWRVDEFSMAFRGGRKETYPFNGLSTTVSDPNRYTLGVAPDGSKIKSRANSTGSGCNASWLKPDTPFDRRWPCDQSTSTGQWWIEPARGSGGGDDFSYADIEVIYTTRATAVNIGPSPRRFEGRAKFGGALRVNCAASGAVCVYSLREDKKPFYINFTEVPDM